jgi:hypothetical protein
MENSCIEVSKIDDRKFGGAISHFIRDHFRPVHRCGKQWGVIVTILAPIDGRRGGAGTEQSGMAILLYILRCRLCLRVCVRIDGRAVIFVGVRI